MVARLTLDQKVQVRILVSQLNIRVMENNTQKSKELAYLLRHDTLYKFDAHGWREVRDLINNHGYTESMIKDIVENNNKQRYEFSNDGKYIRARQGHSIQVDVELEEKTPPDYLYHGTSTNAVPHIMKEGIKKQSRLYVHLSETIATARNVGTRHGNPKVLCIHAKAMVEDGIKFYLSRNNVWLVDYVDPKYIV